MTLGEIPKILNRFCYAGRTDWWLDTNSHTNCIWLVQAGWYPNHLVMGYIRAGRIADQLLGEST